MLQLPFFCVHQGLVHLCCSIAARAVGKARVREGRTQGARKGRTGSEVSLSTLQACGKARSATKHKDFLTLGFCFFISIRHCRSGYPSFLTGVLWRLSKTVEENVKVAQHSGCACYSIAVGDRMEVSGWNASLADKERPSSSLFPPAVWIFAESEATAFDLLGEAQRPLSTGTCHCTYARPS